MDPVPDLHRLAVLHDLEILDTPAELAYDEIAALASSSTGSPIAAVNFVDGDRHWTKAAVGIDPGHGSTVPSDLSFCAATVRSGQDLLCVSDTLASDAWRQHPFVASGPRLRSYAGAVVVVSRQPIGVVCIYGDQPRRLSRQDERSLRGLASRVAVQLELRKQDRRLLTPGLTDALTGVANERLLVDRLETAIAARSRRGGQIGVVVCPVEDARHERPELADRLLVDFARRLLEATDNGDTVARSSALEFAVVLPGLEGGEQLDDSLTRIRASLQIRDVVEDHDSVGIGLAAVLVEDGETASSVLQRARSTIYPVGRP